MNILLTSAGRRISLLRAFQEVAHARGGTVLAGDRSGLAPALYLADGALKLPSIQNEAYVPHLLELIQAHGIQLLIPTIDTELPLLAESAAAFAEIGCCVMVAASSLVEIAGDKWKTFSSLTARGIATPSSWLPDNDVANQLPDKLFVKPRDGSASRHTYATTPANLKTVLPLVPNAIIQAQAEGPEITIDALLDLEGRPIHYVPRRRIRTLAGESIQGVTIDDSDLRDWLMEVLAFVGEQGGRGPITLQAFLSDEGPVLVEINPRFGGGFPLALAAGAAYPAWLADMVEGQAVEPRLGTYQRGLYMTRYYMEHFTTDPL